MSKSDQLYHSELIEHVPDWYFDVLKHKLENDSKYSDRRDEFILDDENKTILHIFARFNQTETEGLSDEQISYYPLCNLDEIELLSNPMDADDYLLKLRADEVNNNIRITRVFYQLRRFHGDRWNFTSYFHSKLFGEYTTLLSPELETVCDHVPAGFINYPDANGCCTKSPFGNIILISFSLKYFLYYGTIWAIASSLGVDEEDAFASLLIAVRTMLGHEALDFEIDPRAELEENMHQRVQELTDMQLRFIIGHEYAHHYLGHLENGNLVDLNTLMATDQPMGNIKVYNYSQQNEFEADFNAINNLDTPDEIKGAYLEASTTFFCILDIYRCFKDAIDPHVGNYYTHPTPVDRMWELRRKFPESMGYATEDLTDLIQRNEELKQFLLNDFISIHTDEIEMYGSNYIKGYKNNKPFDRLDF